MGQLWKGIAGLAVWHKAALQVTVHGGVKIYAYTNRQKVYIKGRNMYKGHIYPNICMYMYVYTYIYIYLFIYICIYLFIIIGAYNIIYIYIRTYSLIWD